VSAMPPGPDDRLDVTVQFTPDGKDELHNVRAFELENPNLAAYFDENGITYGYPLANILKIVVRRAES
jgi:hypothetical protein